MSKPPLIASTGTFGSGPAPSGSPPEGLGQSRQKSAFPSFAAHEPKRPKVPAGSAEIAWVSSPCRLATGVSGVQGKAPSRQDVAA